MHPPARSDTANRLMERFPPADRTIATLLVRCADRFADKPLLVIDGERYTVDALIDRAGRSAAMLREAGVGAGDRIAILCGNRIEFFDLLLGCAWLNAVAVPINRAARGPQLQHILTNSGASVLAVEHDAVAALEHIDPATLVVRHLWILPEQGMPAPSTIGAWRATPLPEPHTYIVPVACKPCDIATIIYTSGTTGPSKGVCCPHAQYFWWGLQSLDILEIDGNDVLLTTLPLFHVNALGSFFQALLSGATLVVMDRFSASGFGRSLAEHKATITYLLGAMVSILLSTPESDADSAHQAVRALAPGVPARFRSTFSDRFGIALIDGYGSTETNFVIGDSVGDQKDGSMGRVRPGFEARVVDEEDNALPAGTPGELLIRADQPFAMASGYFQMAEQTLAAWRNLWFHTGDRVVQDAEGYFFFMDRLKDAIRRRGENISAYEVEQVLLSHPAIANAAVYPVPSELGEDEVMAAIILREGETLAAEALLDFCQPRLTYFSIPRFVLFADELPMTENGKIQKFRLRDWGVTPATWDREAAGYVIVRQRGAARA